MVRSPSQSKGARGGAVPWIAVILAMAAGCAEGSGELASGDDGAGGEVGSAGGAGGAQGGAGGGGPGGAGSGATGGLPGPGVPGPGDVIFVELMPDPGTLSDFDAEWLELKNVSGAAVELSGCRLTDLGTNGDDHAIDESVVIEPGAVALMAKTTDGSVNGNLRDVAYAFGDGYSLSNGGDEVRLECAGALIDEVVYDTSWPFTAGGSMQLSPAAEDATSNDQASSWCAASVEYYPGESGTPGSADGHCTSSG